MYTTQELEKKIIILREQWKSATGVDKKIIEIRGKAYKVTLDARLKKTVQLHLVDD